MGKSRRQSLAENGLRREEASVLIKLKYRPSKDALVIRAEQLTRLVTNSTT